MTNRRNATLLEISLIALAVLACYSNVFHGPFVFDDLPYIQRNGNLRSAEFLGELWRFAPTRFLTYFSLFLNFQLSGLNVLSYHVVNILIHLGCAVLVYFLVQALFALPKFSRANPPSWLPFLISLIFAIHPVQTEAVTYIWQRSTSLAVFFYLAAMLSYTRLLLRKEARFPFLPMAFAVLAMFTKQITITLPLSLLLIEYLGVGWEPDLQARRRRQLWPMLATLLIIPLTLMFFGDYDWREIHTVLPTAIYIPTRAEYLITEIGVVRDYFRLLLFPLVQKIDYDVPFVHSFWSLSVIASLALHTGLLTLAVSLRKRIPLFSFGILFFYLALSVESTLVPLADAEFEHRLYLPSFGFIIALSSLVPGLRARWKFKSLGYAATLSLLLLGLVPLGILTWHRNLVWTSTEGFWKDAALKAPGKSRPLTSYARIMSEDPKNEEKVIQQFEQALKIDPKDTMAALSLALIYENKKDWLKAFRVIQLLAKVSRDIPEYKYTLAGMYLLNHQEQKGLELLRKVVAKEALDLRSPDLQFVATQAYLNLMNFAIERGDWKEAVESGQKLLEMSPDRSDVRSKVAYAQAKKGDTQGAIDQYMTALDFAPGDYETLNNLAVVLEQAGKVDQASSIYEQMIRARPDSPAPQINQVLLMASHNRWEEAAKGYQHLPSLGPDAAKFYSMMARTFFDQGHCDLAIDSMSKVIEHSSAANKPLLVEMHSKLAQCYTRKGDRALASEHAQAAKRFAR